MSVSHLPMQSDIQSASQFVNIQSFSLSFLQAAIHPAVTHLLTHSLTHLAIYAFIVLCLSNKIPFSTHEWPD